MDRRHALRLLGAAAASPFLAAIPVEELEAAGVRAHRMLLDEPGALTPAERAVLSAAVDTIIPRTTTPGARDVGVPAFAEHMLARWYPATEGDAVRAGLVELDATARRVHGRGFASLDAATRLALLEPLDAARASGPHWFGTLRHATIWGWCTAPVIQQQVLHAWPLPGRFDADARRRGAATSPRVTSREHGHE